MVDARILWITDISRPDAALHLDRPLASLLLPLGFVTTICSLQEKQGSQHGDALQHMIKNRQLSLTSTESIVISRDLGPKFPLGRVVITSNAMNQLPAEDVTAALRRHIRGDWGELETHDREENQRSLQDGCRLLSAYRASNGIKFWIITEADRSVTTVLLPEDY